MYKPKKIKQEFDVKFNFDLHFTSHVFSQNNNLFANLINHQANKPKVLFIIDSEVAAKHQELKHQIIQYGKTHHHTFNLVNDLVIVPGGEVSKNQDHLINTILEKVNLHGIDRHSYITAIGGGAVLDAVGYAAAIAHRGVRLIRIPTTVLSQNDSGIGVKNGINFFNKKNFVGTFALPHAVINDDQFLSTLNDRDWRSGISEAIKVALIKDLTFFEWIENHTEKLCHRDLGTMNQLIFRCAELHMQHIQNSGDPFERGSSRPLDFGHWSAHKLEQLSNFEIKHGEAVAIGMALDSTYSFLEGWISEYDLHRILNTLLQLKFSLSIKEFDQDILSGLEEFREHLGGELTIMLLSKLGRGVEVNQMKKALIQKSINYINTFALENQPSL